MYELGQKEERAPYGRVEESLGARSSHTARRRPLILGGSNSTTDTFYAWLVTDLDENAHCNAVDRIYLTLCPLRPPYPTRLTPAAPSSGGHFFNFRLLVYRTALGGFGCLAPGSSAFRRCLWSKRTRICMQKPSLQPKEGYVLEIDGKFESEYGTFTGALKAGLELRQKFPQSQVKLHDANEQTPADDQSENKKEAALN